MTWTTLPLCWSAAAIMETPRFEFQLEYNPTSCLGIGDKLQNLRAATGIHLLGETPELLLVDCRAIILDDIDEVATIDQFLALIPLRRHHGCEFGHESHLQVGHAMRFLDHYGILEHGL